MIWKDEYKYENIFYVTDNSAGIKHGCIIYPDSSRTPSYCLFLVQR
jgi:hypothetical protein